MSALIKKQSDKFISINFIDFSKGLMMIFIFSIKFACKKNFFDTNFIIKSDSDDKNDRIN